MCKGVLPLSFFCPPSNKVSGISDRQVVTNVARGFDDEAFERAAKLLTGNACVCFFFFKNADNYTDGKTGPRNFDETYCQAVFSPCVNPQCLHREEDADEQQQQARGRQSRCLLQ